MKRATMIVIVVFTGLIGMRRAEAFDGPMTWAEAVCQADAAVTLEINFDGKFGPNRVKVVETHMNLTKQKVVRKDWSFASRAFYWVLKGAEAFTAGKAMDADLGKTQQAAVDTGSFRMVILLGLYPSGDRFGDHVMPLPAYEMVSLSLHPKFETWWAHIKPMLDGRAELAKTGKLPTWCPTIPAGRHHPESDWTAKQKKVEAGWYEDVAP
jgi:hypothetical protein